MIEKCQNKRLTINNAHERDERFARWTQSDLQRMKDKSAEGCCRCVLLQCSGVYYMVFGQRNSFAKVHENTIQWCMTLTLWHIATQVLQHSQHVTQYNIFMQSITVLFSTTLFHNSTAATQQTAAVFCNTISQQHCSNTANCHLTVSLQKLRQVHKYTG